MSNRVSYEPRDGVAVVTMDDGKANALSHEMIAELRSALSRAAAEQAPSVLLVGRPGRLSAGFDLKEMQKGPGNIRAIVTEGAELLLEMYTFARPIVVSCTGHAIAAGALMLLASDFRIGAAGDAKIGLNEVAIGMTLPVFGVELARARLSKRHFELAVMHARIYDPVESVDAGFLDEVVVGESLAEAAFAHAVRVGGLSGGFAGTKERARGATARAIRATLESDINAMVTAAPTR